VSERAFSIVICTDARRDYLKSTLQSLHFLDYDAFEVCVVCGPSADGTRALVETYQPRLKMAAIPERNLSRARNTGIQLAAGEIIAFLDDDATPEPQWLADLNQAYDDRDVVAAGGLVYDGSGVTFQARFVTIDRLGYPHDAHSGPTPRLNYPFSPEFPHLLGANCSFRRKTLIELGGFDEEYEYFLDETDMICRVVDSGCLVAQLNGAPVHHKSAPSPLRRSSRVMRQWRPVIKNRLYFGYRNGLAHHTPWEVLRAAVEDAASWQRDVETHVANGDLEPGEPERFRREVESGIVAGLTAAREPSRKLMSTGARAAAPPPFLPFVQTLPPHRRLCICLVSQDYPPGQNGGIARNVQELGAAWARLGHHVHVFTRARAEPSVAFEEGVWVHRLAIKASATPPPDLVPPYATPRPLWDYSRAMFEAITALDAERWVDLVYAPLWDCEPMAFLHEPQFPLLVALQTTLDFWLDSQPERRRDPEWMRDRGAPVLALERWILERAPCLHANSRAILADIEQRYEMRIPEARVVFAPHGMSDWAALAEASGLGGPRSPTPPDAVRFLFVGRLESRKGIDVLLRAAPEVLRRLPHARLDIVGDDRIERAEGGTYKAAFLGLPEARDVYSRIVFHGRVEEDALRRFYRDCDVLVAPSRYESFGLVYLEGMMFGKPVIGGRAGGGPEVIEDGVTGMLVAPGDAEELTAAMMRLGDGEERRARLGRAGRRRYEAQFQTDTTAELLLERALGRRLRAADVGAQNTEA
jgi:glycogen(starch) synthase